MTSVNLFKTKASSLAKIDALPRYRHPADLLNEFQQEMSLQRKVIYYSKGQISPAHQSFMKKLISLRKMYTSTKCLKTRNIASDEQFQLWQGYLSQELQADYPFVTEAQSKAIFEGMQLAKERHEQRLHFNRFAKWANEYAKAYKFDLPIDPLLLMKMVHPAFGYFRLLPNEYKLTFEQFVVFLNEVIVASAMREKGWTLHSEELIALIYWRILSKKGFMTITDFCRNMEYFKFAVDPSNFRDVFAYTIKGHNVFLENQIHVSFDFFRRLSLDRNL